MNSKKSLLIIFSFTIAVSAFGQSLTFEDSYANFEKTYLTNQSSDTIYVYNFWATWCKPCIQELPYFDSLNNYKGDVPIKLVLVSLDFEQQIETVLKPFIKKRQLRNDVVVLTDGNVNNWINKVDSSWSGAIPATLVLNGSKRLFYEKTYHTYNELLTSILKITL